MWIILLIFVLIFTLAYYFLNKHRNYFKDRNVPFIKSHPILGTLKEVHLMRKGIYESFLDIYNDKDLRDEPFFGMFLLYKPAIFVKDPELIKRVLIKDFNSFSNRYSSTGKNDPFKKNVFFAHNPIWRNLRRKISTFFTSGKLKAAFYLVEEIGTKLIKYLEKNYIHNGRGEIDLKKVTSLFTMDVIGSVVFGVDAHGLEGVNGDFQKAVKTLFSYTPRRALEISSSKLAPALMRFFNLKFFGVTYTKFMLQFLPEIVREREKNGSVRNDMIDLIIEIKKEKDDSICENDLLAQAGVFMSAGIYTKII